ncbi:MAG TPA: hypothetical protein VGH54_28200 [Mycobacterium sp.]|jgi:hypothetical protein|uniref:hypothetical protein n=1 Tax=Mycobacterium sp. TaxID=1785 RepID=UPI002F3F5DDB
MRVLKQLPIPDGDADNDRIWCNWDDCENPSSFLHRVKICHAAPRYRHPSGQTCRHCEVKTFCSARCLDWWEHSHIPGRYGKTSPHLNPRFV